MNTSSQDAAIVVVGMGGHAFMRPREQGTCAEQRATAARITEKLLGLGERGYNLIVRPGNAPHVGNLLRQNQLTRAEVLPCRPAAALEGRAGTHFVGKF